MIYYESDNINDPCAIEIIGSFVLILCIYGKFA